MLMKQRKGKGRASKPPPSAAADRGAAADDADDSDDADDAPPLPETAKPPTAPPKKRGKFDPLGDTAASRRYAKETLKHDDYRGSGLSHGNPTARHQRARKAAAASHAPREIVFDDDRDTIVERDARGQVSSEMHAARRYAICYVYETVMGAPPESAWGGRADSENAGVIAKIAARLSIPENSFRLVRKVLEDFTAAGAADERYDADACLRHGAAPKLELDMEEGQLAAKCLATGMGLVHATIQVNEMREAMTPPRPPISWSAVQSFEARCPAISTKKRATKKSGKTDETSEWAIARVAQCKQMQRQLKLGEEQASRQRVVGRSDEPPVHLDGLAIWDEHHHRIRLGHQSRYETRLCLHPETGEVALEEDGSVWTDEMPSTHVKYPGEARGCFGAAKRTKHDGTVEGVTLAPFNYTGKTVVGVARFKAAMKAEWDRVLPLKGQWKRDGFGYAERYPDVPGEPPGRAWRKVEEVVKGSGGLMPVTEVCAAGARARAHRASSLTLRAHARDPPSPPRS